MVSHTLPQMKGFMQVDSWPQLGHGWLSVFKPLIQQHTNGGGGGLNSWVPVIHGAKIIDKQLNNWTFQWCSFFAMCRVVLARKGFMLVCANQLRVLKNRLPFVLGGPGEHSGEERTRATSIEESTMCSRNMKARTANLDQRAKDFLSGLLWLISSWEITRKRRLVGENHDIPMNF